MKNFLSVLAIAALLPTARAVESAAVLPVRVSKVERGAASRELTLPAELQAEHDTPVRARADGYVEKFLVDIGDHVKDGQVLAIIEAPDLVRRLEQAKATLESAKAKLRIARDNSKRAHGVRLEGAVSPEEIDSRDSALSQSEAAVAEAAAEYARYEELGKFLKVTSPFDGVVAERNTDVGRLVSANNSGTPLFRITDNSTVRAYIGIPQGYIAGLKQGSAASVLLDEYPDRVFTGTVSRISGAIDPASRTLLAEVRIPNSGGELLPGMFCRVKLSFGAGAPSTVVSANALMFGSGGPRVAVVGKDDVVRFRKVTLGHDNGTTLEVVSGLTPGETVIMNPGDLITDGCKVTAANPEEAVKSGAGVSKSTAKE